MCGLLQVTRCADMGRSRVAILTWADRVSDYIYRTENCSGAGTMWRSAWKFLMYFVVTGKGVRWVSLTTVVRTADLIGSPNSGLSSCLPGTDVRTAYSSEIGHFYCFRFDGALLGSCGMEYYSLKICSLSFFVNQNLNNAHIFIEVWCGVAITAEEMSLDSLSAASYPEVPNRPVRMEQKQRRLLKHLFFYLDIFCLKKRPQLLLSDFQREFDDDGYAMVDSCRKEILANLFGCHVWYCYILDAK